MGASRETKDHFNYNLARTKRTNHISAGGGTLGMEFYCSTFMSLLVLWNRIPLSPVVSEEAAPIRLLETSTKRLPREEVQSVRWSRCAICHQDFHLIATH